MLPKKYKLKKIDFENIFKVAKKFNNEYFVVLKANKLEKKFGVFPSLKEFKKAVERNKIKRRIFEIIRLNFDKIPLGWFLIFPKKNCLKLNFEELKKKLLEIIINIKSTNYSQ